MFRFRVLGPLGVHRQGVEVPITAPRERELLAALLLRPDAVMSVPTIVDVLWGENPPATAETALQVHVSALRRKLGANAIATAPGGYRLQLAGGSVDRIEFERLIAEGRRASESDVPRAAFRSFTAGLALYAGRPYAEIDDRQGAMPVVARLVEAYWDAVESRFEAGLSLGKHGAMIPDIREQLQVQPHRERLVGALMVGLYRMGRAVEALDAYRAFRELLLDDLGLDPSPALVALERDILRQAPSLSPTFPSPPRRHIPSPPTPIIGRERELAHVDQLVVRDSARLVTLTGAGGTGKTRLAIAAAQALTNCFESGAGWIDLSQVHPDADVLRAMTHDLNLTVRQGETPAEVLVRALQPFEYLLLLDNFEHLIEQSGAIGELLRECPALQIVATSREPLRIRAEVVFPIGPLSLPASDEWADVEAAAAAELFVARARAATGSFVLSGENSPLVARLCRRLDGLPLALELAAARIHRVPLAELDTLANQSDEPLLRDLPARQRTMESAIRWSFELLELRLQDWLLRLAPFVSGVEVGAAARVWGCEMEAAAAAIQGFIESSLLQPAAEVGRVRMLEPIRDFCWAELGSLASQARLSHLEWVADLAMGLREQLRGAGIEEANARIALELPNIRAGVALAAELGAFAELGRIIGGVWAYLPSHGLNDELEEWVTAALRGLDSMQVSDGTRVLVVAGEVARYRRKFGDATAYKHEAFARAERAGDVSTQAAVAADLSGIASSQGDFTGAYHWAGRALELRHKESDPRRIAHALVALGDAARRAGDLPKATDALSDARARYEEIGFAEGEMVAELFLADVFRRQMEWLRALETVRAALEISEKLGDVLVVADALLLAALLGVQLGEYSLARDLLELGFQLSWEVGYEPDLPDEYDWAKNLLSEHGLSVAEPGGRPVALAAMTLLPDLRAAIDQLASVATRSN